MIPLFILAKISHYKPHYRAQQKADKKGPFDAYFFSFSHGFGNNHGQRVPYNKKRYDKIFIHASRNK